MNRLEQAIGEMCSIETQASKRTWFNELDPLAKLFVTICYVTVLVSFHKYNILGVCSMFLYPMVVFTIGEIPFQQCIKRIRLIFPLLLVLGVVNPFFDRTTAETLFGIPVSGGVISMLTLFLKGFFSVLAVYLLMVSTTIEKLCNGLRRIHVPEVLVTVILLIYRYINVLLKETNHLLEAYAMRAPEEKGLRFRVWGTLVGNLLLRSMDRAHLVYDSMNLRGYEVGIEWNRGNNDSDKRASSILWAVIWSGLLLLSRMFPVFSLIGRLLV